MLNKKIFIITGPSGAGEDSVINGMKKYFSTEKIITSTTRPMRPNETAGEDYYFLSHEKFQEKINNNEFFEWALADNGNYYGGERKEIERVLNSTKVGIWKIDYKGAIKAKKLLTNVISIYLHVPIEIIAKRLKNRKIHDAKFIEGRIEYAQGWYKNREKFDHEVYNEEGKLDETIEKVANIIKKYIN